MVHVRFTVTLRQISFIFLNRFLDVGRIFGTISRRDERLSENSQEQLVCCHQKWANYEDETCNRVYNHSIFNKFLNNNRSQVTAPLPVVAERRAVDQCVHYGHISRSHQSQASSARSTGRQGRQSAPRRDRLQDGNCQSCRDRIVCFSLPIQLLITRYTRFENNS